MYLKDEYEISWPYVDSLTQKHNENAVDQIHIVWHKQKHVI